ncbi:MAG: hypothetical protein ACYC0X_20675 [Pirellulaceae bacterium]
MPFLCEVKIHEGQLREPSLTFDGWVATAWGKYLPAGSTFAWAHDSQGACEIQLVGPGVLTRRRELQVGDSISAETLVVTFLADGEAIPYGQSCRLVYSDGRHAQE